MLLSSFTFIPELSLILLFDSLAALARISKHSDPKPCIALPIAIDGSESLTTVKSKLQHPVPDRRFNHPLDSKSSASAPQADGIVLSVDFDI
jgi:hypothetical protein